MSILRRLWGSKSEQEQQQSTAGQTESVRKIVAELASLPPDSARYIAGFAYILGRVARADLEVSDEETREMEQLVHTLGKLPREQAALVVQLAQRQGELFGATEDYLVTREFKDLSTPQQRRQLLDCLFAVSAADDSISSSEEAVIRQITSELRLDHKDFIAARMAYSNKREVMKLVRDRT